ncbi:MAG: sugar-binding protein [Lachnospiraceae bacterium]|nr:sugar-binding protein [Lachnospiraceae bacterium]
MKSKNRTVFIAVVALLALFLTGCSSTASINTKEPTDTPTLTAVDKSSQMPEPTATSAPTSTPEPTTTPLPTKAPDSPFELPTEAKIAAFDENGRINAVYGTPVIDGTLDDVWKLSSPVYPEIKSSPSVKAAPVFKVMWDEEYLYTLSVVSDDVLNKASGNAYEQDSVEVFLDELNDKAGTYQADDVHYRVNFDNEQSTDAGDPIRWVTASKVAVNDTGKEIGYLIEAAVMWSSIPANGTVFGFDLQVNEAGSNGSRVGTVNVFDKTGSGWEKPSVLGEVILCCKEDTEKKVVKNRLEGYLNLVKGYNLSSYANPEVLDAPKQKAESVLANTAASQEEVDAALAELKAAVEQLNDGSGYVSAKKLPSNENLPDPYQFLDGTYVNTVDDWSKRAEELYDMYQYYMYGVWRDGTGENLSYNLSGNQLKITVEREGKSASFTVTVSVPDADKCKMPEGGWPVIVGMHSGIQEQVALDNGYATVILNTYQIASDDNKHVGAFYDLYPYGKSWQEQTGVLMAWSWGASKVLDALEAGLGDELNINGNNSIITGVSRWGKAAAVCGAFETRFKMVAPSCSGAGGLAVYRYTSTGNQYDFSSKTGPAAYTYGANEPLSSLQSSGEQGWFNDMFLNFSDVTYLPVDQYMLASLYADKDRYLFIIGSCINEDWVNAPSMYLCYKATKSIYDFLGIGENIAINIHKEGHAVIAEDMNYMIDYFNYHVYGKEPSPDLSNLTTSVFEEDKNYDPIFDNFNENWYR